MLAPPVSPLIHRNEDWLSHVSNKRKHHNFYIASDASVGELYGPDAARC
jgi:hypothetical protein